MSTTYDWSAAEDAPVDPAIALQLLARRLPKAELHMHFAGSIRPTTWGEFIEPTRARTDQQYDYTDSNGFFQNLDMVSYRLTERGTIAATAFRSLQGAIDNGCRHVELMVTPQQHLDAGGTIDDLLSGITDAFRRAGSYYGLTGGIIVEMWRPFGSAAGIDLVRLAADARERGLPILGVGNDGPPEGSSIADLGPAYLEAKRLGLRTTCHADIPQDVVESLDLPMDRLDHAFDMDGRPELYDQVIARDIPVTMGLCGNVLGLPGRFPRYADHPFERLRQLGVRVSLHTDDPALYFTDLIQEYATAAREFGWDAETLGAVALESLRSAWLDDTQDARLAPWAAEIDALVLNPRNPALALERNHNNTKADK